VFNSIFFTVDAFWVELHDVFVPTSKTLNDGSTYSDKGSGRETREKECVGLFNVTMTD
jgi:hypothetical protein